MAKFSATDQTALFGATALANIVSIEYPTISADAFLAEIAGAGWKPTVTGMKQATVRINILAEDNDATTLATTFAVKTTGTWTHYPATNTSGKVKITSTKATVISAPPTFPTNGLAAVTIDMNLDDYTVALVS